MVTSKYADRYPFPQNYEDNDIFISISVLNFSAPSLWNLFDFNN
jgi:hypothetical protein